MDDYTKNVRNSALALGIEVLSLQHLAGLVIRAASSGKAMNDETLLALKAQCINGLKNMEAVGLDINQEAKISREALNSLSQLVDEAISWGRRRD